MKKYILASILSLVILSVQAQDSTSRNKNDKSERKAEKRRRISAMIKQEEEGVLSYHKQSLLGLQVRNNGYGLFYELGRMKTPRFTNLYMIELTETKDPRENKSQGSGGFLGNPLIYGKINNFYQAKLGFGQQYILGQKGNKNGIAIMGIYQGGLSLGLLKPYYVTVNSPNSPQKEIKYEDDPNLFLDKNNAGAGFSKGWNELEFQPGLFVKGALRFDFGRYNEQIQALQIGLSVEGYGKKVPIMAMNDGNRIFVQGHLAFLFGRRK